MRMAKGYRRELKTGDIIKFVPTGNLQYKFEYNEPQSSRSEITASIMNVAEASPLLERSADEELIDLSDHSLNDSSHCSQSTSRNLFSKPSSSKPSPSKRLFTDTLEVSVTIKTEDLARNINVCGSAIKRSFKESDKT